MTVSVHFSLPHLFRLSLLREPVPFPWHLQATGQRRNPSLSSLFLPRYASAVSDKSFWQSPSRLHKKPLRLPAHFPRRLFSVHALLCHQHIQLENPDGLPYRILWIPGEIFPLLQALPPLPALLAYGKLSPKSSALGHAPLF